ncbi:MAG TPA: hypothetical protein DDW76_30615 [Cyanobacteria bacterium UBA11369]|nr:hypothetical protein [Cyanobacteria bacterium UBA11371]HBE32249.1 hypothetical protein [Cyanobacteria bacterium UBA11368]HBE52998.1 hypothetical protein [Cyanobacteria bacterium UBA11369]
MLAKAGTVGSPDKEVDPLSMGYKQLQRDRKQQWLAIAFFYVYMYLRAGCFRIYSAHAPTQTG